MTTNRPGACAAIALAVLMSTPSTTQAQVAAAIGAVAGAGGIVGGAVSGTAGGVGTISAGAGNIAGRATGALGASGTLTGPTGTLSGLAGATDGSTGPSSGFGSAAWRMGNGAVTNLPSSTLATLEAKQQVIGQIVSLSPSAVTVRLPDGTAKTFQIAPGTANTLRAYVGKTVHLRTVDGTHISSVVGQNEAVRGTVAAINGNLVTFVTPTGEIHSLALNGNGVAQLHLQVGSSLLSSSSDFGKSARLSALNGSPRSALADVYMGRIAALSPGNVVLGIGPSRQQFAIDATLGRILGRMGNSTVAAYAPDGTHVSALLTAPALLQLVHASRSGANVQSGRIAATVMAASRGNVTLQMPNGDVASYVTNPGNALLRARVPVTVTPLDSVHVRIAAGARAATLADAGLCATVNASCRGSETGHVIAVSPTFITARLANGDSRTFLGNVRPLVANAGVPVTITPLDAVHARITAQGHAANLMDATACVTINAACRATPATVVGTGPASVTVRLPDGRLTTLQGNPAPLGVSANVPVIVQPLDRTHAMLAANGNALQMADAGLCVTLNTSCPAGGAPTPATASNPLRAATAAVDANAGNTTNRSRSDLRACARLNAPGCTRGNTGAAGPGGTPSAVARIGNANNAAMAQGPVRTASTRARACATLNAPGCGAGTGAGSTSGNRVATLASGCVSVNGSPCAAPAGPLNSNAENSGAVSGNGGGNGSRNAGILPGSGGPAVGPNASTAQPASGSPTRLASFDQVMAFAGAQAACSQDGQVTVQVSDAANGRSMAGASVKLLGTDGVQWATSPDGMVRFLHLSGGTYRVRVMKPGYGTIVSPTFDVSCAHASSLQFHLAKSGRGAAALTLAPHITPAQIHLMRLSSTCVSTRHTHVVYTHRAHRVYASRVTQKRYLCH